ncbi:hypothetical protein [Isoptericola aurantiacus]|uniref:hypothetical protein n=1 Tax=Isoptericola aurantiacus TaxID=3377839 RepID=UPI00383B0211
MWYLPDLFDADPVFAAYLVGLILAGLATVVTAVVTTAMKVWVRLLSTLAGIALLGYGIYLYLFLPVEYIFFWYVVLLPVALLSQAIKLTLARRREAAETAETAGTAGTAAPEATASTGTATTASTGTASTASTGTATTAGTGAQAEADPPGITSGR